MARCPSCGRENPEGFAFCGFCATPLVAWAARERKVVSVLFCELVGFTARSEVQDPEDVHSRLGRYWRRVRSEIESYGGAVEKFVGDAVLAVFGVPTAHEDDPERAVRAGLRILDAIDELTREDPALALEVRIGINTGEAVVSVGGELQQGLGDVANTAARIQAAAPVGGIAASKPSGGRSGRSSTRSWFRSWRRARPSPCGCSVRAPPAGGSAVG